MQTSFPHAPALYFSQNKLDKLEPFPKHFLGRETWITLESKLRKRQVLTSVTECRHWYVIGAELVTSSKSARKELCSGCRYRLVQHVSQRACTGVNFSPLPEMGCKRLRNEPREEKHASDS